MTEKEKELAKLLVPLSKGDKGLVIVAALMAREDGLVEHLVDYMKENHIDDLDDVFEFIQPGITKVAKTD